jgi:hypothetical protein
MRSVIIKARALELGDSEMERANPAVERAGFWRRGVTNAPAVLSLPGAYYGRTTPRHNDLVQTLFSGVVRLDKAEIEPAFRYLGLRFTRLPFRHFPSVTRTDAA